MRLMLAASAGLLALYSASAAKPSTTPAATAVPAKSAGTTAQIEAIGLQLFYLYSGTLSEDISAPSEFIAWNTIIGEGDAKEPADDALVTVRLRSTSGIGQFDSAKIVAKDGRGEIVGQRIAEPALTDEDGRATIALWLHDVGCAGKLTIIVTAHISAQVGKGPRKITHSKSVNLDCGE